MTTGMNRRKAIKRAVAAAGALSLGVLAFGKPSKAFSVNLDGKICPVHIRVKSENVEWCWRGGAMTKNCTRQPKCIAIYFSI